MLYEIKKLYLHQNGLLCAGLYLMLSFLLMTAADKPANLLIEENRRQYFFYLEKVEGRLTARTEEYLLAESRAINQAQINLDKLYDSYYDGKTAEETFLRERSVLEETLRNRHGFALIFEQYIYVRENPAQRYFLFTNGWDGLLSHNHLDFLTVFLILLLATPVFCHEFDCAMDAPALTMKKGGRWQAIDKIILTLASVAFFCLLTFGMRYLFFSLKYGLSNGTYPLQSLSYYATAGKGLALIETFIYTSLLKLFGYLSFSALVLFVAVCVKKYALTLLISAAVILLPLIGLSDSPIKYLFTGPLGLMLAASFFRGGLYKTDRFTGEATLIFPEIPVGPIIALLGVMVFLTTIMLFILLRLRSNKWRKSKVIKARRIITVFVLLITMPPGLTGCSDKSRPEYDIYNFETRQSFQNAAYRFFLDETDIENFRLVFEDLESGEVRDFVRTPLQSTAQVAKTLYGNGDYVYYLKYNVDRSGFREAIDRIAVVSVDTRTFNEKIIYEKNIAADRSLLMGTVLTNNEDLFFLNGVNAFFVDDNNIYFIGNDVRQVSLTSGKITALDIPTNGSIAYDGQRIYFIGDRYQLSYYDTETKDTVIIPDIITTWFYLAENELLFLNRLDQNKPHSLSFQPQPLH